MNVKFKLSLLLIFVWRRVNCNLIQVTKFSLPDETQTDQNSYKGAKISYGKDLDSSKGPIKENYELTKMICIPIGQSLELTSKHSQPNDFKLLLKVSVNFGPYLDVESLSIDTESANRKKFCLLFGFFELFNKKKSKMEFLYLNLLTDEISIDEKDILYLYVQNNEDDFTYILNKNTRTESSRNTYPGKYQITEVTRSKPPQKKVNKKNPEIFLNKQRFLLGLYGNFYMTFVDNDDIQKDVKADQQSNPAIECKDSIINVIYSNTKRII